MFYKLHIYKCFDKYSSFFFSYKIDLKNSYSNLLDIHRIRRYIHFRFFKNNSYFFNVVRRFGNFDFADCDDFL